MIPLYPPRQGDATLRVKWRSLAQLVSHSHNDESQPRVRSLSTVVFFPSHRKLSSSSQKIHNTRKSSESNNRSSSLERRRPSAPLLSDLRRFLPNLMRSKSSTSVVVGIEGEECVQTTVSVQKGVELLQNHQAHQENQRPVDNTAFGAAKNKVQRLKAISSASPKETGVRRNFFKKQGRKQVEQEVVLVSVSSTSAQDSRGFDESAPLICPQLKPGNAQKSTKQTAIEHSFHKSVEQAVDGQNPIAQTSSASCVIVHKTDRRDQFAEEDQESQITVVVDPSSLLQDKQCREQSSTKGSALLFVNGEKAGSTSTLNTASKQRILCSDHTQSCKEEVLNSTVEQRLPSQAFNSTSSNSKPQIFKSNLVRGHLTHHPASSPVLSSSFHIQSPQTQHYIKLPASTLKFHLPYRQFNKKLQNRQSYPFSRSEEIKWNQNSNRNYYSNNPQDSSPVVFSLKNKPFVSHYSNPQNTLFVRRHSFPDMAIAAYGMVICGGTDELQHKYRGRIEKVKFGVPISEAFTHDIPATLLVLLLKVNKEGPLKKDIWRAPGNQAQVRKLSHIMQHGRLVNISHISVYTAASVIKKFLSKLPGGILGPENEELLFANMREAATNDQQRQVFCRIICSLSTPSQHLLVLLFGTFRIIADSAETFNTRMTPDAIGISVAPSLFKTCMQDENKAKLEDVLKFKLASQIISKIIQSFGYTNLFPRECYEFYARITGRTLRVDEHYQLSFSYPSNAFSSKPESADAFSSMLSTITAAMANRSYSLETLGQHPTQSLTPPLLRQTDIQRGGSLKITTPTSVSSAPSTSRQPPAITTTSFGISASTSAVQSSSYSTKCQRMGPDSFWKPVRIPLAERPNTSTQLQQQTRRPPIRQRQHADLVYATRVLVADEPPKEAPPPLPKSLAARLADPEIHTSNSWTFSQPSICFGTGQPISSEAEEREEDQPGPSGFKPRLQRESKEGRRRSSEAEDEDVYSEELPGTSRTLHPRRDRAASSGSAGPQSLQHSGYWRHASRDPFSDLMEQRQLSTSMGEVLLHSEYERVTGESLSDRPIGHPSQYQQTMTSRCVDSLESTRSLTYLEWVHEKQTKRMRTRSEWFLSPVMPQKNNGASKSFDFHSRSHFQHSSSPLHLQHLQQEHLKLPETDTDMSLHSASSTEEMRTASSHSSSIKEQRPLSPIKIVDSALDPVVRKVEEMGVMSGETTPRLPFQLLQHHSGDSDDAPLSATPPARHQASVFFGDDAPPAKAPKSSSSSSSGSQSQKSVIAGPSITTVTTVTGQQPTSGLTRVSSIGVVRRKSWRTHYIRPNKSLDQESAPKEDLGPTSHSTPAGSTRRSSANGDKGSSDEGIRLIRRKSSNSASKSKVPVQVRKSTQI